MGREKFTDTKFVMKSVVAISVSFCFPETKRMQDVTIFCTKVNYFNSTSTKTYLLILAGCSRLRAFFWSDPTSSNTYLGSVNFGSNLSGATKPWQTTKISADSFLSNVARRPVYKLKYNSAFGTEN